MLERPGCFIVFAVAALLALGVIANAVNPAPREAEASFADRQQIAPTPSATTQQTATPDVLATTAASSAATNAEAQASIGNTQSANGTNTAISETQTPASWTATAVNMRHEIDAAERDQALLGAQLLAETLTMAPTSAWMTDVARWPTAQAEQTQAAFAAQQADKQRGWDTLILFLLDTGVRIGEAQRADAGEYDPAMSRVWIRPFGTGRKTAGRYVYVSQSVMKLLDSMLARRGAKATDPLFASRDGGRIDRFSVKNILYRLSKETGVRKVHAHRFRHTMAIEYLRNGGDLLTLQRLLGHKSLNTTRRYLKFVESDLSSTHRRASPVASWGL